jgi:hypothetical protein
MPNFNGLADAKRIIEAAWDSFDPDGAVNSRIGGAPVTVTWHYYSGTMDTGTEDVWVFTGDQNALAEWWRDFGDEFDVLPPQYKGPELGYQINLQYLAPHETWFNFHLSVPDPDGAQ